MIIKKQNLDIANFRKTTRTETRAEKGFSIIGLLIASVIIAVTLTAGLAVLGRGLRTGTVAKNEITASVLAEEGLEIVRNIRDAGDTYCLEHGTTPDGFQRIEDIKRYAPKVALNYDEPSYLARNTNANYWDDLNVSNAGLCRSGNFFTNTSCGTSSANFIRVIKLESGGDCESIPVGSPAGTKPGITVTSTVYWRESWESVTWPTTNPALNNIDSLKLYNVSVSACLYDWRI